MANLPEQFKINLNQNLWGLVVAFTSLGVAEHLKLCVLFWFATVTSIIMVVSILITTFAYTQIYWRKRTP